MIFQDLPGLSVIGWGYDVFGHYANPESRMQPLFDFGEMTEVRPEKEEYIFLIPKTLKRFWAPYRDTVFEIYTGSTAEKIRTSLASKTRLEGNYGFFSGSLEAGFSSSSLQITTMRYTQINQLITRWIIQLPAPDVLKGLLLPEVQEDIDGDFEAADLFDRYGTHYLWNLLVGGRISYTSATNTARYKSTFDVSVAAEMSYQSAAGSINASNETKYGKSIDSFRQSSEIKARARGGKAEYVSAIKTGGITQENWGKWAASIEDFPEFVGYVDNKRQPSLLPIWELCSDADRMKSLKDAYHEYAEKQPREIKSNLYPVFKHTTKEWVERFTLSTTRDPVAAHGTGWSQGEAVFYAYKEQEEGTVPIYQYSAVHKRGVRFGYSIYEEEGLGDGWVNDMIAFYAYKEQEEGTIPVYQAHSDTDGLWRYAYSTIDVGSEAHGEGWVNDHIAFYAYDF
jgi:hypothetical protein